MPKRKHSELETDLSKPHNAGRDGKVNEVKATRLRHKFERGAQLLFRALKTARGFERQKLGRRQKTARQDGDSKTLERLEKEVQALKALDLEETAERYLYKQLIKTKRISESPEFARLEKSLTGGAASATGPRDPAEANVTARLFKSNPVKNALPDILADIRSLLGVNEIRKKPQKQNTGEEQRQPAEKQDAQRKPVISDNNDTSMNDASDDDDEENMDYAQFDTRLASTSDVSDSEEDSTPQHEAKPKYNLADDISVSSNTSESSYISQSSPPPKSQLKSRSKKGNNKEPDKPLKDTTFLPSLMIGGYWSGSESGNDNDDDTAAAAAATRPQRKNRMGQQARRALWEKKFGTKANHLQKQKQKNKNSGWDMRRGATDESDTKSRPRWAKHRDGQSQSFARRREDRDNDNRKRPKSDVGGGATRSSKTTSLHPSWEAARKAKEQKAQASFEGKKIVFD